MKSKFSDNLKNLRIKNKLLKTEIAEDLEFSSTQIYDYEKGRSLPNIEQAIKLATYFRVTTDELLGMEPIKKEPVSLSSEENELLRIYRQASAADQNIIQTIIKKFDEDEPQNKIG